MHIRTAEENDVPAVAEMLALAFAEEPFTRWLFPDEKTRLERERELFTFMARRYISSGLFLTDERSTAAALCQAPGAPSSVRVNELADLAALARICRSRFLPMLGLFRKAAARRPKEPHLYIEIIGVHPSCQGTGKGSALLGHIIALCDRQGWTAYLECADRLVPYYGRFGFALRETIDVPQAAMRIFTMARPAARA